jgi:hypothetical protein
LNYWSAIVVCAEGYILFIAANSAREEDNAVVREAGRAKPFGMALSWRVFDFDPLHEVGALLLDKFGL